MRLAFALLVASSAMAEDISFHRPEAWAMAYVASATIPTSLGPVAPRDPWLPDAGVEADWLPPLSSRQELIGFEGTKQEDINRLPMLARLRFGLSLPGELRAVIAWIPPVEVRGVRVDFVAAALERPLWRAAGWSLGARLYGETGRVDGDITCTPDDAAQPPGSPGNPVGCTGASDDSFTAQLLGLELQAAHRLWAEGPTAYAGAAVNWMKLRFQVRVHDFFGDDRTLLRSHGETASFTLGVSQPLWRVLRVALEGFYTPLTVDRPFGRNGEHDGLANLRILAEYSW
jgi:hypothetical protein